MKLIDLNREGGIGANCLLLELAGLRILVDCGLNPKQVGRAATPDLARLRELPLDLIIITHCHLDHIGSLPVVMREHPSTPVIMSSSSRLLIERMLRNSASVMKRQKEEENIPDYPLFSHAEIERLRGRMMGLAFGQAKRFRGHHSGSEIELIFHPAGHVAGAAGVELVHKHRHIFLTGDVLFEDQRIVPGAKFPSGHFDTLVMETTRGDTDSSDIALRGDEFARLVKSINDTIQRGGSFLIPIFALGRMQEVLTVINDARKFGRLVDCPIYASGLGMDLVDYFDEISRKTRHIHFNRSIVKDLQLQPLPRKLEAGKDPQQNALYIISSGMMVEKTPSNTLASGLVGHARNTIGFVGYCDPDTPGGQLLASKPGDSFLFEKAGVKTKVKARVERFELSGHADRDHLLQFAVQAAPRAIVLTHGDAPARKWFSNQLTEQLPNAKVIDPTPGEEYQV
ncbi:MBL fold metallo-hydrolase [Cephaloticoccus capnophilus]|uniref:MBL fold metallo-hydrolase n=1 Tax=Cephaloticoccus capnophilus TaxID=1548208 RepID=A0A139SRK1_9BACT|nr:MBL fold metallo-hydrolase [Cephaloticoccus capnophilus]KXU37229.1 MBL fold metallo-hydrolase [Cephaloticoccus capnophilus]